MFNFSYENQGSNTYLVYEIKDNDSLDTMSLGMLTNNNISGLAPSIFTQMDTIRSIKYNITARVPASQFLSGHVTKKRLIGVFKGVVDAMLEIENYMIDQTMVLMDLDYVFADVSTCDTVLICLPISLEDKGVVDVGTFFKEIMFKTKFDQSENCEYIAEIINYINSTPVFSLLDFRKILEEVSVENDKTVKVVANTQQNNVPKEPIKTQPKVINNTLDADKRQPNPKYSDYPTQVPVKQSPAPQPISEQQQKESIVSATTTDKSEPMSLYYLLRHYSKENHEIYKAGKAKKKDSEVKESQAKKEGNKQTTTHPRGFKAPSGTHGFAIPGQEVKEMKPESISARVNVENDTKVANKDSAYSVAFNNQENVSAEQTTHARHQSSPPEGIKMNFGETTILAGAANGETTVLNGMVSGNVQVKKEPHIIRVKNNEDILINKPVFRVGKERSYVDYFIGDNTAVSRSHANIITREKQYFIVDTNSTNHTYINGEMLPSGSERELVDGDRIRLANEEFEFRVF